jgi:hypothetical protein
LFFLDQLTFLEPVLLQTNANCGAKILLGETTTGIIGHMISAPFLLDKQTTKEFIKSSFVLG